MSKKMLEIHIASQYILEVHKSGFIMKVIKSVDHIKTDWMNGYNLALFFIKEKEIFVNEHFKKTMETGKPRHMKLKREWIIIPINTWKIGLTISRHTAESALIYLRPL